MFPYTCDVKALIRVVGLLLLLAIAGGSSAGIYKCVDEATGEIAFTDKDCPDKTPGNYHPIGYTNSDSGSASLNEAGTRALRNGVKRTGNQQSLDQSGKTNQQPKPEAPKAGSNKSTKDTLWFERRMCQKRSEGNCHSKYPVPR